MAHGSGDIQVSLFPSSSSLPQPTAPVQNSPPLIHRAASYNAVSQLVTPSDVPGFKKTFSDVSLAGKSGSPSKENILTGKDIFRRVSHRSSNSKPEIAVSRFTLSSEELDEAASLTVKHAAGKPSEPQRGRNAVNIKEEEVTHDPPECRIPGRLSKSRSVSGKIASLARKSWMSTPPSRSPSPSVRDCTKEAPYSREHSPTGPSTPPSNRGSQEELNDGKAATDSMDAARKKSNKKSRRPLSALVGRGKFEGAIMPLSPSSLSLRSRTSFEKLRSAFTGSVPPLPRGTAVSFTSSIELPRKKDELWNVFRGLEADYQKFQSKSGPLKVNIIRSTLLTFFARYDSHSCHNLRPEDLDRRVNILNKWWIGLLEMLNGRKNLAISGTDRPVYLEAVTGIMMRPEWRIPFLPSSRSNIDLLASSQPSSTPGSYSSSESGESDFLIESIYHNIRNIFAQNLLSQMAFVVDRMSMRHAPASLVCFCGKACAYAFFFCPGVADILVRLWNTPTDILRRILAECSVYRGLEGQSSTRELTLQFPLPVRALAVTSHAALVRYLRQKLSMPLSTTQISWQGPWLSRWCGRDTDLFFVFVKYFHILFAEFLSPDIEGAKRILAPGILLVHGQLLVVLEDTLHKQSASQLPESLHSIGSITFDDFIEGPDAAVPAHPLGVANCHRSMAENRLIILLRDFLSDTSQRTHLARKLYAESFCGVMKAAARKTSLFDHNSCFVLCDFIEEVALIISRYSQEIQVELFEWEFWLSACKQMTQSHNSLTEVRVFAFIFSIWNVWTTVEQRKQDLCLGFLLREDTFYHYFSHWSPMVRAYFHRLLCWRVSRYHEDPSRTDSTIYDTLSDRLEQIWAYYLCFQSKAAKEHKAPLSSAPCSPAPGRRIIIIRNDDQPSPASFFVSFDRIVPPTSSVQATAYRNHGSLKIDSTGLPPEPQPTQRKKWGILKTVFSSSGNPKPGEVTPPGSSSEDSDFSTANRGNPSASGSITNRRSQENGQDGSAQNSGQPPQTPHQRFCFKFSLEWLDRPQWPSKNKRLFTPCLPVATQLHVQGRRSLSAVLSENEYSLASDSDIKHYCYDGAPSSLEVNRDLATSPCPHSDSSQSEFLKQPRHERLVSSKYAGRALAEWAQVVSECDGFFERRRDEGVPCDRLVETPTLGVESFRK